MNALSTCVNSVQPSPVTQPGVFTTMGDAFSAMSDATAASLLREPGPCQLTNDSL